MTILLRRRLGAFGLLTAAVVAAGGAFAQEPQRRHAVSMIGEPKYGPDFKHFGWVNPDAPKGGRVRQSVIGSFDSLNQFPVQGEAAGGLGLLYDTLFVGSPDEASAEYGKVAEWIAYPADVSSATFGLRSSARFHDGKAITPDDVIFSLDALKRASPQYSTYYKDVISAEKTGPNSVTFKFSAKNNRELPQIVAQLPILPKHWWEAKGADGNPRDITKSSLEMPLGSGPYKIKSFEAGKTITYERIKDWWAKDLPVAKGQWNFDELTFIYFRERTAAFENFKTGGLDFWRENSAKSWATEFEFDAVKRGLIKTEKLPIVRVASMQAFVMNLRRKQFQDVRVRRALNLAFDFEWANKNLFYDQYIRVGSYFDNSELGSKGLPKGRELEILTSVKADVPDEVFTTEWKNPVNATPEDARRNLSAAAKLLAEAGYVPKSGVLTNASGEQLTFEILLDNPIWDRIVQPYRGTLEKLGIKVNIRQVDSAQYQRRMDKFDYDVIIGGFPQSESPGNEQRNFFGSAAADLDGSRNTIGVKNKAIDKLIDAVIFAKDRADLVAATNALDRVLLWNHYVVPNWHLPFDRIAMWDQYGRPNTLPARATSFTQAWWFDEAKAKALADKRGK
jgi:microcin C transport system substrate-binding protein